MLCYSTNSINRVLEVLSQSGILLIIALTRYIVVHCYKQLILLRGQAKIAN